MFRNSFVAFVAQELRLYARMQESNAIPTAIQIARYLKLTLLEIDILKSQILLVFAQAYHLKTFNSRLFIGTIKKETYGPLVQEVYDFCEEELLDMDSMDVVDDLPENLLSIVDAVSIIFHQFKPRHLITETHKSSVWENGNKQPVTDAELIQWTIDQPYYFEQISDLLKSMKEAKEVAENSFLIGRKKSEMLWGVVE